MTPTRLILFGWIILALFGLLLPFAGAMSRLGWALLALFGGFIFLDYLLARKRPIIQVTREVSSSLPVTAWSKVKLTVLSHAGRPLNVSLGDHYPAGFNTRKALFGFVLEPDRFAEMSYEVYPLQRGSFVFSGVDLVVESPLRLWRKKWFFPCVDEVMVFPNFREIANYALLSESHQLNQVGIKEIRQKGQGGEFHQLRDYRQGDELSRIDWKATSRMGRLVSREFQNERDQQVIFMLDCGRRMRHKNLGRSFFDQALNSMLLLAHVAAKQGDGVGVYTLGGYEKWIPPLKYESGVQQILHNTFELQPTLEAADYLMASSKLMALQNRRSLVILITNSRAEDQDDVLKGLSLLRRKHLVVLADLREVELDQVMSEPVLDMETALSYISTQDYLHCRRSVAHKFRFHGIYVLDVTADNLPVSLVNTYLEIKNSARL